MSNSSFRKKLSPSSSSGSCLSEWGLRGHSTPVNRYDGCDDCDDDDWDDDYDDDDDDWDDDDMGDDDDGYDE